MMIGTEKGVRVRAPMTQRIKVPNIIPSHLRVYRDSFIGDLTISPYRVKVKELIHPEKSLH